MSQKILIVDDSPFIRRVIQDWLKSEADFEIVGTASDGEEAVQKAIELRPDIITLDVEMPKCNGIQALEQIMKKAPTAVIMVSSVTTQGAQATLKALDLGALDFVTKPNSGSSLKFLGTKEELVSKVRALKNARINRPKTPITQAVASRGGKDKVVLVASSTGGPKSLATLFQTLPKGFAPAMLIVQHMPPGFTKSLAERLNRIDTVPCREAEPGDRVTPGLALLAPGGKHMIVRHGGVLEFTEEPPMHGVRPAADLLFFTACDLYGSACVGAVLTGMGRDGAEGAVRLRKKGAAVFGENEDTCTVYGMPKAAKDAGGIDAEFPIHEIGHAIMSSLSGRLASAS